MRFQLADWYNQIRQRLAIRQSHWQLARYHQSFHWYRDFLSQYLNVHQSIIGLTVFILLSNALLAHAANTVPSFDETTLLSEPYQIADTVRVLSPYTPNIEEDPDAIALNLEERDNGSFIAVDKLIATQPGVTEEPVETPKPTVNAPTPADQKRSKDIKYTVEIGDTLSGIGAQYGLKLATIKVKNNLSDVDSIKPGQELLIPVQDLSDKALKAAEERRVAQTDKKIIKSAKASRGYGLIVPIHHNGITRGLVGGHTGIDYRANVGTTVVAADSGIIADADGTGWNGGYGDTILINHGNGMTTRYAHLNRVAVRPGERVEQGEVVGYSGNTGRSTGPHLHFELRINGVPRNPF